MLHWLRPPHRPLLCGHRGNPEQYPDNTLDSFASAWALGMDAVEVDIRITCDGELFCQHDRRAAGRQNINLISSAERRVLGFPSLDDVLQVRDRERPDGGAVLDVKTVAAAERLLVDVGPAPELLLISFSDHVVRAAQASGWPTALLSTYPDPFIIQDFLPDDCYLGANFYQAHLLSGDELARSFVGGVNDAEHALHLAGRGAWCLNSDRPAMLASLFGV